MGRRNGMSPDIFLLTHTDGGDERADTDTGGAEIADLVDL